MTSTVDAAALRAAFARAVTPPDSPWHDAFASVPRHLFVPAFFQQRHDGAWRLTTSADDAYWGTVYSDAALTTQLTAGEPTSSSSQPSLMLSMLDALDAEPGHQVLEIGTGTGYNAALLAHRLGGTAVTTVDVDPALTGHASDRLAAAGHQPHVHTGDGAAGVPARSPFDRIIATCGMTRIPQPWIEQSREGAVILAPVGWGLARLTVAGGRGVGRFLTGGACFMPRRTPAVAPRFPELETAAPRTSRTRVDPSQVAGRLAFPLSLALPGYRTATWSGDGGRPAAVGIWTPDGAAARVDADGTVRQAGPRGLWDEAEALAELFPEAPRREDFGLEVGPEGQHAWYGAPDGPSWAL